MSDLADAPAPDGQSEHPGLLKRSWIFSAFFLGVFGANIAVFPISSLLLYFLTDTVGIGVALATVIMTIPKVWDMIVDPAIGAYADKFARSRGNRFVVFVPLAFFFPPSIAAIFILPDMSPVAFAIAGTLILIAKSSLYTIFLVSHVAAADDIDVAGVAPRNSMLALRIAGQAAGGLGAGAIAPLLIGTDLGLLAGYPLMGVLFACIGGIGIAACGFALKDIPSLSDAPEKNDGQPARSNSMWSAVKAAANQPAALGLIISSFAVTMAGTFMSAFLPYVNKYLVGAPDAALAPMFMALMGMMLLGSSVAAWISSRIGNPRTFDLGTAILFMAALLFYPASFSVTMIALSLGLWGFGMGIYVVSMQSSLIDEAKGFGTAGGLVGLLLGLLFAGSKIGDTVGGILTGGLLAMAGTGDDLYSDNASVIMRAGLGIAPALLVASGYLLVVLLKSRKLRRT